MRVPRSASDAHAGADPTVAQAYDYTIPTSPKKGAAVTAAPLGVIGVIGVIGVMISGWTLFNPYEGDGTTVAKATNFFVTGTDGSQVWFLDTRNGHPTPMGQHLYHALPGCVTATIDQPGGPSHILGLAFDGFPIYGDRDATGSKIGADALDACTG